MKVRIEIDTRTFVRFWLVVIGFIFAIFAIYLSRTALVIIGASAFLALALNAPVNYLSKYIPGQSRILATALSLLSFQYSLRSLPFYIQTKKLRVLTTPWEYRYSAYQVSWIIITRKKACTQ
jgi:hypothetical protein